MSPQQLSTAEIEAWARLKASNPSLYNPFFDFEYTQAFGAYNPGVEVGVMRRAGEIVGFFPYERDARNRGWPVGRRLSDFHGIIGAQDLEFDAAELLHKCELRSWQFNNLVTSRPFQPFQREEVESGYIDLAGGFEAYEQSKKEAGSSVLKQARRKIRKIEREVGPLRFEWRSNDQRTFEKMLEWKSAQRVRTRTSDPIKSKSVVEFLDHLKEISNPNFCGLMSVLYVGDDIAAVHLGLQNPSAISICFPTYNHEFSKYSPGLIFFLYLMEACADRGIQRIDLGAGDERYKSSLMTGSRTLSGGTISRGLGPKAWYSTYYWARKISRHPALEPHKQKLKYELRGLQQRLRGH